MFSRDVFYSHWGVIYVRGVYFVPTGMYFMSTGVYFMPTGVYFVPKGVYYPIAFGLPATVPIPVRSGPQGSVTILYCAWSFVTNKCSKTKRNAGLFLVFLSTPFGI